MRRFVFVLNNYTEEEVVLLQGLTGVALENPSVKPMVTYALFAKEVGASGTPHIQGYLETAERQSFSKVRKICGIPRLALQIAKGSLQDQIKYISKQNQPTIIGSPMAQGSRTDFQAVHEMINSGHSLLNVADEYFGTFVRYHRGISRYIDLKHSDLEYAPPVVKVYYGKPGSGKTRAVHDVEKDLWAWPGKEWFDGYSGNEAALFDDFDGKDFSYRLLLRVLDRYPISVPTKGGHVPWRPKRIYLTSNIEPTQWYILLDSSALTRRIHEIKLFE